MKIICRQSRKEGERYIEEDYTQCQLWTISGDEILKYAEKRGGVIYLTFVDFLNILGKHLREHTIDINIKDIEIHYEVNGEFLKTYYADEDTCDAWTRPYQIKDGNRIYDCFHGAYA